MLERIDERTDSDIQYYSTHSLVARKPPLYLGFSATSMALMRCTYSTPPFRNLMASESLGST